MRGEERGGDQSDSSLYCRCLSLVDRRDYQASQLYLRLNPLLSSLSLLFAEDSGHSTVPTEEGYPEDVPLDYETSEAIRRLEVAVGDAVEEEEGEEDCEELSPQLSPGQTVSTATLRRQRFQGVPGGGGGSERDRDRDLTEASSEEEQRRKELLLQQTGVVGAHQKRVTGVQTNKGTRTSL